MADTDGELKWITDKLGTYNLTCNFSDSHIYYRYVHHDNSPGKRYSTLEIAKADGLKMVSSNYDLKEIEVVGYIKAPNYAELNDKIDEMKEHMAEENGILEVDIGSSRKRRYYATAEQPMDGIEDDFGNTVGQEWRLVFICYDPFGYDTVTYTSAASACAPEDSNSIYIEGTAPAVPTITLSPLYETVTSIEFENETTNEKLTMEGTFLPGHEITMESDDMSVTYGGENVLQTGAFPSWPTRWNNYTISLPAATAACVLANFSYIPRYL